MYSEKATNSCEISALDLFYVVTVKSTVEILQNLVAFSEYMNFTYTFIVVQKASTLISALILDIVYQLYMYEGKM